MGGLIGGGLQKILPKHEMFKIPKYPTKTLEWFKEKIESPEERLLSLILSKDLKVIQTWALRKKLRKGNHDDLFKTDEL